MFDLPREIVIHGISIPAVSLLFLLAAALCWGLDFLLAVVGAYRFIWHPALFRVSLFVCLFCAVSLPLYR